MTKILSWNIGSFIYLRWYRHIASILHRVPIHNVFFQSNLNAEYVSRILDVCNPDIVCLEEMNDENDIKKIKALERYPYYQIMPMVHHEHKTYLGSKMPFAASHENTFEIYKFQTFSLIPVHLNSYHSHKRYLDSIKINQIARHASDIVVHGDTNLWSRGEKFLFSDDRRAYQKLTEFLIEQTRSIKSTTYFGIGLDKVFSSPNIEVQNLRVLKHRGLYMDHYPIYFEVRD